ncbi:hypothetical protein [Streptomyces iconiensis]|uniref:DUF2637 domain-containing protein n=1 Tax=Streptomyces iconiensis TaxID=1384038 RepID=A0ABT7A5C4_9ACTN|nr:hypothetical protein [Streptomyces iconiensis]MDJ1136031.1 hypothetical protein [Streptomyces iconiensis]
MNEYPDYSDPYLAHYGSGLPTEQEGLFLPPLLPGQRQDSLDPPHLSGYGPGWDFDADLTQLLQEARWESESGRTIETEAPLGRSGMAKPAHRRGRRTAPELLVPVMSFIVTTLLVATFAGVSTVGGIVTYGFARTSAASVVDELATWWPVLLHGPWVAASLFMLRSPSVRGRRARAAWSVLLFFSAVTAALCLTQTTPNFTGIAVAVLPPLAALACLRLLVLHIAPVHPRHALSRRKPPPSHRAG